MAYSTEYSRAIAILLFTHIKMEEYQFEFVSTKVISEHLSIPAPTVVRILKSLNNADITTSKEGAKGGILLARPITEITLLDVFNAVEHGPLFKTQLNFSVSNDKITNLENIVLKHLLAAELAMKHSLSQTTLADIFSDN